jgi:transcriptional regulator GlxA family with amidase domain
MTDFTILVLPGAFATSVAVTLDVLQAAASLAPRLKLARPSWRVLSPSGGAVSLSSCMRVDTATLPKRHRPDAATWIIPGLGLDNAGAVAAGLAGADAQRAIQAVAAHAARGGRVAASCSAVFLLHAAGLLAGPSRHHFVVDGAAAYAGWSRAAPSMPTAWCAPTDPWSRRAPPSRRPT